MQFKIKKLQQGGFATFTPILSELNGTPEMTSNTETSPTKEKSSVLDEDIYKALHKDGGLANDVHAFVEEMEKLESRPMAYLSSTNRISTLRLFEKVNLLRENKASWEESYKAAASTGGLNEVAVGSQGELFVRDSNHTIKQVSLGEYSKNKSTYIPMTVAELLSARKNDPNLVFNQLPFEVANNSIGNEQITNKIKSVLDLMGSITKESTGYKDSTQVAKELAYINGIKQPTETQLKGIQQVAMTIQSIGDGPAGIYKVTEKLTSNKDNIAQGMNYLWSILDKRERDKIMASHIIAGGKGTINEVLAGLIQSAVEQDISISADYEKEASVRSGYPSVETDTKSLTAFQMFHKDKLRDPNSTFVFNNPELSVMFKGTIGASGPLLDQKDDSIGMTTLSNIMNAYGYNRLVDSSNVYFGNKKVDSTNKNNIIYDGESVAKIYMPVSRDGQPDYEEMSHFKDVYAVYEANKNEWSVGRAQKHFRDNGYNLTIDEENGEKVIRDNNFVKPFLIMYGYTNDATGLTDDNKVGSVNLIQELSDEEEESIVPQLEALWTIGSGKSTKDLTPNKSWNDEDYYRGIIAIPYLKNASAVVDAIVGQGPKDKAYNILDVQNNLRFSSNMPMGNNTSAAVLKSQYGN